MEKGIAMMIATVKIQLNASIAMAITVFFSRDCPTWKKEKAILKVKYEKSITFPEARKIVEEQFAAKVTPASIKVPVYTFHAPMHKRKQMKRALLN